MTHDLIARVERIEAKIDELRSIVLAGIQAARDDIERASEFYDEYIDAELAEIHEKLGLKRDPETQELLRLETPRQAANGTAPARQASGAKQVALDAMRHGATPKEAATKSGASLRSCQRWRNELAS